MNMGHLVYEYKYVEYKIWKYTLTGSAGAMVSSMVCFSLTPSQNGSPIIYHLNQV